MITTLDHDDSVKWVIEHNLCEYGLDIKAGYINWYFRTSPDNRTPDELCLYLISKNPLYLKAKLIESAE